MPAGTLHVVATPIGNLEDITLRALRVLREVDFIAAEDTRQSRKLLARYDIHRPLVSLHEHSGQGRLEQVIDRLAAGESCAYVTDAGTPGVSDPVGRLAMLAHARGVPVVPVPGPSAPAAALSVSGLEGDAYLFLGFLPQAETRLRERLAWAVRQPVSLICFAPARRLGPVLAVLAGLEPQRPVCLCREMTKRFEEYRRGTAVELSRAAAEGGVEPLGEATLVIGPPGPEAETGPADEGVVEAEIVRLVAEGRLRPRRIAALVAARFGIPSREAYVRVLSARPSGEPEG